jgi:predicted DNA-binding transcriptional regulator AlpA
MKDQDLEPIKGRDISLTAVRGRLLLAKEVALFLRVSERWVQSHMNDGTFPVRWFYINAKDRVVDSADLDDWLKKTVINAGTAPLPLKAVRKHQEKGVVA